MHKIIGWEMKLRFNECLIVCIGNTILLIKPSAPLRVKPLNNRFIGTRHFLFLIVKLSSD